MWYRRFVSWLRSLFTPSSQVNAQPAPLDSNAPTLPLTAPLMIEPFDALDEPATLPPPIVEFPAMREPPTTVPLARLARPSEPLTGAPASDDSVGPAHISWISREPAPASQPLMDLRRAPDPIWSDPEAGDADAEQGSVGGEEMAIEPGSELYRRLMILRRLVRQGVYDEGFASDETPEQYRRYPGMSDLENPFDAE